MSEYHNRPHSQIYSGDMTMYPKWITRAVGIGPVLVGSLKEEEKLLEDWEQEQLEKAEADAAAAKAVAQAVEEDSKVVLKTKGR